MGRGEKGGTAVHELLKENPMTASECWYTEGDSRVKNS